MVIARNSLNIALVYMNPLSPNKGVAALAYSISAILGKTSDETGGILLYYYSST
jgi:hypothetical protein